MPFLLMIAAATVDLDALDQAVQRCDRSEVNPMFEGEAARRSQVLLDTYHEQEGIVADRLALAGQQRTLRETTTIKSLEKASDLKLLDLQQAALDDRQKALNDKRLLEGIRDDAMDSLRRYFLLNCPAGEPAATRAR